MRILGIDPGVSGGAAVLDGTVLSVIKYDSESNFIEFLRLSGPFDLAYIERVGARPGQGVASMFKFGQNYGFLRGALRSHDVPLREVTPQTWQKALGVKRGKTKTEHKNNLLDLARQLYPKTQLTLATCDAVLIAEYGRRLYNETT
jgi:crossover junction endodeoxyribonuclease RuvC